MGKIGIQWFMAMLICAAALAADSKETPPTTTARAVMEKVTADVLAILRDSTLSADQKREKVQQIAFDNINFDVMGRLSIGRFWRDMSDAQKSRYQQEFKQHVTNTYGHTTDDYTDEDVKVINDRQEQDGDFTVQTRITGTKDGKPNQEIAKVDYRLRKQDDQWKVIDFTIDGVSLVANFRSQFEEIISNGGVDQLIKLLHDKNAANAK